MSPQDCATAPDIASLTLEELIDRLAGRETVDGIIVMGTATGTLNPTSDYDLFVVLSDLPVPLHMIVTWLGGRLTEAYFTTAAAIDSHLEGNAPTPDYTYEATQLRWLQTGRIAFDRSGRLGRVRAGLRAGQPVVGPDDSALYAAWFGTNYDILQTRRMLASADPVYLTAVDIRLLYTLHQAWFRYFLARGLPAMGEKDQVRYLDKHDPGFLEQFRRCLGEPDRTLKVALYERLAGQAIEPIGGLWVEGATAVNLGDGASSPEKVREAMSYWEQLIGAADGSSRGTLNVTAQGERDRV